MTVHEIAFEKCDLEGESRSSEMSLYCSVLSDSVVINGKACDVPKAHTCHTRRMFNHVDLCCVTFAAVLSFGILLPDYFVCFAF